MYFISLKLYNDGTFEMVLYLPCFENVYVFSIFYNTELLPAYRMCWEKFGWSSQKADELLLPVLKQYNKHAVRDFARLTVLLAVYVFFCI